MTPFLPIARLLSEGRPPRHPVAFGRDGVVPFAGLESDVAALLPRLVRGGSGTWLLHSEDPYAAAVGLLACAHTGAGVLLAPNPLSYTVERLRGEVAGALVDADQALEALPTLRLLGHPRAAAPAWRALDRDAPFASFLTSGTTGDAKLVPKRLRHLDDEVRELESRFGEALGPDAQVFATVSHQHIYGLLFRLLWPLAAGRPFARDTFLHASEFLARMETAGSSALVASPAHLKRMRDARTLRRLRGRCRAVFSSGGPLDAGSAASVRDALGEAPREIFGSSETGGVAWRQRGAAADADAWTPFGPVSIAREPDEGRLEVLSPYASVGTAAGERTRFVMGDRVELLPDGRFRLLGRADRVVNIGEIRLSLPEMEAALCAHPTVEEAALVTLVRGGEERIHAAVVPNEAGWRVVHGAGRRAAGAALGEHLAARFDRVLLPRAWRFVEALPCDAQGKATRERLRALFETPGAGRVLDPSLRGERRGAGWLERDLAVPHDLAYFEGHFEGRPTVAGVVQLRWALDAAGALLGAPPRVHALEVVKFARPLGPGTPFTLRVERPAGRDALRFELRDGTGVLASGRCRLERTGGTA